MSCDGNKKARGLRRRRIVLFGPADGATVPELPVDSPILHGGAGILPDGGSVVAVRC
jgi:hypothetical protein